MKVLLFTVALATVWLVTHGFRGASRRKTHVNIDVMKKNMVDTYRSTEMKLDVNPYGEGSNTMNKRKKGLKRPPLSRRSGSRPLTRVEKKAKELYQSQFNDVERVHSPVSRVPLSELTVGQKLRGRIISVKDFGLFVDVGSKRDGLVHVKDVSKDYFISQLETKFVPGQDIDVWVKFCEPKKYKLGLQMFPVTETTLARSQASLLSSKAHRESLASTTSMRYSEPQSLTIKPIDHDSDDCLELSDNNNDQIDYDGTYLTSLEAFAAGDQVEGKVVRMSNYGVFVDFGAEVVGFLHKRKMAVAPKRRAMKPWEINPIGSQVTAYVVDVDLDRRRINLSTYSPDRWAEVLPSAPAMVKTREGKYLPVPGSISRQNYANSADFSDFDDDMFSEEALERQLAATLEDDEDDEDESVNHTRDSLIFGDDIEDEDGGANDKDFDIRGEELSAAEVRALMKTSNRDKASLGERSNVKILIDDFRGNKIDEKTDKSEMIEFDRRNRSPESIKAFHAALAVEKEQTAAMEEGEDILTEEIFADLCPRGQSVLTIKEVKKWDYIKHLIEDGDLNETTLRDLVLQASQAETGKLTLETFDDFIDLLAETLGLEEIGSEIDKVDYLMETNASQDVKKSGADIGIGSDDLRSMVFEVLPDDSDEGDIEGLEDIPESEYELVDDDDDDDDEDEEGKGGQDGEDGRNSVVMGDPDEFVFTVETVPGSPISSDRVSTRSDNKDLRKGQSEADEEEDFSIDLSIRDDDDIFGASAAPSRERQGLESLVQIASKPSKVKGADILKYVFASVSNNDGAGASIEQCLEWEFVRALLDAPGGPVAREDVVEAFHDCVSAHSSGTAKQQQKLDLSAFNEFMSMLTDLENRGKAARNKEMITNSLVDTGDDEDLLDIDLLAPLPISSPTDDVMEQLSTNTALVEEQEMNASFSVEDDDDDDDDEDEDWTDEADEEEMTIEEAFEQLSGGKNTVTMAQIKDWDVIDELFAAGVLDTGELSDMFNRAGAKGRNTLTLDGFETLLDLLSPLTDDISEDEGEVLEGLQRVGQRASEGGNGEKVQVTTASMSSSDVDDAARDDIDEEILLRKVFSSISNGKTRATVKDLLSWDFVLELMGEGLLTEDILADKMLAAGGTLKGIEVDHFDALVNSLVDLYEEEEESEQDAQEFDNQISTLDTEAGEHDDDEEEFDVDIDEAFQKLAESDVKDATITASKLMEWDLLQATAAISESEVVEILQLAGVEDPNRIDREGFEAFIDMIVDDDDTLDLVDSEKEEEGI